MKMVRKPSEEINRPQRSNHPVYHRHYLRISIFEVQRIDLCICLF